MAASSTKINLGKPGEFRTSSASKGQACTTTASYSQLLPKTERIFLTARNFSTAAIVKVAINPYLCILKTIDGMASMPLDYSSAAQDASTSTEVILSGLNTVANGDFLLVGAHLPFRGCYMDVNATNSTGSVTLTVSYWNGNIWVDTANTDGWSATAFDQDGLTYWTVPTAWTPSSIEEMYPDCPEVPDIPNLSLKTKLYWTRWEVDTAIDSSVTLYSMVAANRSTTYAELVEDQMVSANVYNGIGGVGCIEALTDAGTANLIVNCFTSGSFD